MGIIMSVGVSVSNAILLVTNAEEIRKTASAPRKQPFRRRATAPSHPDDQYLDGCRDVPMATGLGIGAKARRLVVR